MAEPFDLNWFRYYIGNPSAWECEYDNKMSDRMRAAADEVERLTEALKGAAVVTNTASSEIARLTEAIEDAIDTLEAMDLHVENPLYERLCKALSPSRPSNAGGDKDA